MMKKSRCVAILFLFLFTFAIVVQPVIAADKIDLNTATKVELVELTGIGEVIAQRIIEYRDQHPFKTIDELQEVKGIGEITFGKIKNQLTVSPASG